MTHKQILSNIAKELLLSDSFSDIRSFIEDNKDILNKEEGLFKVSMKSDVSKRIIDFNFELNRIFFDQIMDGLQVKVDYHFGHNKEYINFPDIHKNRDILLNRVQYEGGWTTDFINIDGDFIGNNGNKTLLLRSECHQCGKSTAIFYDIEAESASFLGKVDSCEYPVTLPFKVSMNIPSKKIVFANDLRNIFGRDKFDDMFDQYIIKKYGSKFLSINNDHGVIMNMETYAELGILYFLTTSSKNIFIKDDKSSITIKDDCVYDEETDEDIYPCLDSEKNIGHIITDLWAVTAMDFDHFNRLCNEQGFDVNDKIEELNAIITEVSGNKCTTTYYPEDLDEKELSANVVGRLFFS